MSATDSLPPRPSALAHDAHKGEAGRVLLLAGSAEMPGAALLAGAAALRGGAGLVTLAALDEAVMHAAPLVRPELILWRLAPSPASSLAAGLAARQLDAVMAGPGLGTAPDVVELLEALFTSWRGPLVLDADALNLVAGEPGLRERLTAGRAGCGPLVITPHPGEAARLLGAPVGRTPEARRGAALALSRALGAVTCLKGAGTLVADAAGERLWCNPSGNPGMATAGSGDVLAGLMAALLVGADAGADAFDAARAAVYLHGLAGDRAAARLGARATLAGDLVDELGPAECEGPWA